MLRLLHNIPCFIKLLYTPCTLCLRSLLSGCLFCLSGTGKVDDQNCAVKGPMIVMRVRPGGMGEKVVSLLRRYLASTQHDEEEKQWQHSSAKGGWQLFEIVGDLGQSDQTEVMNKLSKWAKQRCWYLFFYF